MEQNRRLLRHLNTSCLNEKQIKQLLSEIFGYQLDESNEFLLPFYSDNGRNIRFGKNNFISCNVTMAGNEEISIEDNVTIGPGTSLLTIDGNQSGPIRIESNVTIGGNVMILPNVHIGPNVTIKSGSIITHDILSGKTVSIPNDKEGIL